MPETQSAAPYAIELILMRQLATHLVTPMFIVDPSGALIFYNEPAERLLGRTYEENGELPVEEWSTYFKPAHEDGRAIRQSDLPLVIAIEQRRPGYLSPVVIQGNDKVQRRIAIAAFPLVGQQDRLVGAAALFWEV